VSDRHEERAVQSCYSTWAERYFDDYYSDKAPYPPVHQHILRELVARSGAHSLLDAGCGPASMLRGFADMGLNLYGFDLTPEMVVEAKRVMADLGVPASHIWQGSVAEPNAYMPPGGPAYGAYDAAICVGVLPHLPETLEPAVFANLRASVRPGGLVAVEARNELFALFTLNRYSREFFRSALIGEAALAEAAGAERAALTEALSSIDALFRTDLPPLRTGHEGEPGYDEVLSRGHNPLILKDRFAAAGFAEVRTLFYHFHALPPMLERQVPALFRKASLALERPDDWRGHFMASAFILTGVRA
jgi:2-polyprenyl-3-methyl-5-hydroxy-6-metoxy-1,4-benzoquinol methylase